MATPSPTPTKLGPIPQNQIKEDFVWRDYFQKMSDLINSFATGLFQLQGDVSAGPGVGLQTATLATVNTSTGVPGTFGDSTHVAQVTVNAKGLVTAVTNVAIPSSSNANNINGGTTGALLYQTAPSTTGFVAASDSAHFLVGGASTPAWANTLTGDMSVALASGAAHFNVTATSGNTAYVRIAGSGTVLGTSNFELYQDNALIGYVWNRSAAAIVFGNNNNESARFDSTGQLGIGGSPTNPLHIKKSGSGAVAACTSTDGSGATAIMQANTSTDVRFGASTNHPIKWVINGNVKMTLDTSANLTGPLSYNSTNGNTGSVASGAATTIFTCPANAACFHVAARLIAGAGSPATYSASAIVNWDGTAGRITADNGSLLTITLSGSTIQVTQTSGATQAAGVNWAILTQFLA